MDPQMLILDEPTEGIQPNIVQQIHDVIVRLNREFGLTIVLVEQNVPFARSVSDRFIVMDKGRIAIHEDLGDQRNTNLTMPTGTGSGLYLSHVVWSDRLTSLWQNYIRNNADDFPTIFDEASGGTNTDADAWHINTETEQEEEDTAIVVTKSKPVYRF